MAPIPTVTPSVRETGPAAREQPPLGVRQRPAPRRKSPFGVARESHPQARAVAKSGLQFKS